MSEETAKPYDPTTLGVQEEDPSVLRDEAGNKLPVFHEKYKEGFKGLLYLGALQDDFEWLGHKFVIRTLRDGELLAIGQLIKQYTDTVALDRAYADAVVAMCVISVDGQELPIPIGETERINEWAIQRFNHVKNNWYSFTVDEVYNRYLVLRDKAQAVVDALGKASAPQDATPMLSDI